jgi:hypothetical protein
MRKPNAFDLPLPLYEAVGDDHKPEPNELHVTTLIGPALPWHLKSEHWDELEDDASNRLWALMGHCMHSHIAGMSKLRKAVRTIKDLVYSTIRMDADGILCILKDLYEALVHGRDDEETMTAKVGPWTIVGTNDHYSEDEGFVIRDWKMTSVWSVVYADHNWEEQLNVYAWLRRKNGFIVQKLEVWALLRDWQKSKMMKDKNYPRIAFVKREVRLWSFEEQEAYVRSRLQLFEEEPRECTPEEKWQTPTVYKIMKKDRKSALIATYFKNGERLNMLSPAECLEVAANNTKTKDGVEVPAPIKIDGKKIYIQKVKGECKRCDSYCVVNEVCPYFKGKAHNKFSRKGDE